MPEKIRILHITHEMEIGGTQQVVSQLVSNLDPARYSCEIACIDGVMGLIGERLQEQGIRITVFSRQGGFDLTLIKHLHQFVSGGHFDIVHCHQYTPYVYGVLAAVKSQAKVVFTEHGRFYPDSYSWKRRLVNPILSLFTRSFIAISAATRQALIDYEWFNAKRISVVYNGMQPYKESNQAESVANIAEYYKKFGIPENSLVFGTIARFDSIKNIPMMIKAFARFFESHPSAVLLLVGDGNERPLLESLVQQFNLTENVIFTGYQMEAARLMALMDVYLLCSFSEGTSMTLLEAMSSGTCSIVTRVGGNVELIEHQSSGIIIDSDDTDDLTKWMIALANNPSMREQLGANAKENFNRRFTVSKMVEGYSCVYDELTTGSTLGVDRIRA